MWQGSRLYSTTNDLNAPRTSVTWEPNGTSRQVNESEALDFLAVNLGENCGFEYPRVLYKGQRYGFRCISLAPVLGRTLEDVPCDMLGLCLDSQQEREALSEANISSATNVCNKVAWQIIRRCLDKLLKELPSDDYGVGGVDGDYVHDYDLFGEFEWSGHLKSSEVEENCRIAGFYDGKANFLPGDLTAANIIVNDEFDFVGFRDWEKAGYIPRRWLVERFTEGTELMGAAEVQLQSDLIR